MNTVSRGGGQDAAADNQGGLAPYRRLGGRVVGVLGVVGGESFAMQLRIRLGLRRRGLGDDVHDDLLARPSSTAAGESGFSHPQDSTVEPAASAPIASARRY